MQFQAALVKSDLGLTGEDIAILMDMFDEDGNGTITLEEFLNGAYDVLLSLLREKEILKAQNEYEGLES